MSGNIRVVLFLAGKAIIRGNRWALVLVILVMSFSYANLIFVNALLNGVTQTIDTQLINTTLANVVIEPPEDRYYLEHADAIANKVWQVPGVTGVGIHLNSGALFEYGWQDQRLPGEKGKSGNWAVIGIDPAAETGATSIHEHIIAGSYLEPNDRDAILLGIEIAGGPQAATAQHLTLGGVNIGDKVRLTYINGLTREYSIKGVFQAKEIVNADHMAYVTRREMAGIMGNNTFADRASQIIVKTVTTGDEESYVAELKALGIDGQIRSWSSYGAAVRGIVTSFTFVASIIGSIGLGVSGIVMFIIIYISVVNKKRQIGILRAIGIKDRLIVWSYLIQALFCAVCGIIIGGCIMRFGVEPYFLRHPLDLALGPVSLALSDSTSRDAVLGLLLAAFMAGVIPVLSITRESIIKAIWGS
jgi:putative ABC transport system permease protein